MRVNKFIVIDKQEDLPTKSQMLENLQCETKLEEFIMPNGDIILACKDIKINAPNMVINLKATDMYFKEAVHGYCPDTKKETKYKENIHGHCYLIKKGVKF